MILKAVLINNTELYTDECMHYNAMRKWLDSFDDTDRPVREKQLDDGIVDVRFGYVASEKLDKFVDHQFESVERRGERWLGSQHFREQKPLHHDPSEFTHENYACNSVTSSGIVKGNNK